MNFNYKLKTRQQREETLHRRIRTENNENPKKISFYVNRQNKQPLSDNKAALNLTENQRGDTKKPQKPTKIIKVVPGVSKMVTETNEQAKHSMGKSVLDRMFQAEPKRLQDGLPKSKDPRDSKDHHPRDSKDAKGTSLTRYVLEERVGAGTFGTVHKARDKKTLEIVAIKRVYQDRKYKNRQLEILRLLSHPNVLKIRDSFFTYEGDKEYLNVVMDYMPASLYESIQRHKLNEMPRLKVKVLAYQLMRGLLYLQQAGIAHRDIKPPNILLNENSWRLIMCDFGSAKKLQPNQPNIAYICSRGYRAPELIFGSTKYSTQVDVWSAGCVIAEMAHGEPVFRAESNIDQLVEIIRALGTPSDAEILEMNPECDFSQYQLPRIGARPWEKILKRKNMEAGFYDLLRGLLVYSPAKRLSPFDALLHPFFDELRTEQVYARLRRDTLIPELFDFALTQECSPSQLRKLIPVWYR